MAYDPDVPPSLITQAIGGPTGLRWYALMWTDPIADVLEPGYISNAFDLGIRAGDGLIYKDTNRGEWDHYDLIVESIAADGSATLAFPQVPEDAYPIVSDFTPDGETWVIVFKEGRQVRVTIEQAADALLERNSPERWGALCDGETDDIEAFELLSAHMESIGGGIIWLHKGTYRISRPWKLPSNVTVIGEGLTNTFIKPTDDAIFTSAQGVIMTDGFTEDADLWEFPDSVTGIYAPGLKMGIGLYQFTVHGNRDNVANANGIMLYAGKIHWDMLGIVGCDGHGMWTECGTTGSSNFGNDLSDFVNMHEGACGHLYVKDCNKHGVYIRGPNDTNFGIMQVGNCGWAGVLQDTDTTISSGGMKFISLHAYSCLSGHTSGYMIELIQADGGYIFADTPFKGGVHIRNSESEIDRIRVIKPNDTKAGDFWGVLIDRGTTPANGTGTYIGSIRVEDASNKVYTSGTDGGGVHVTEDCVDVYIGKIQASVNATNTISQIGVKIEGDGTVVGMAVIRDYEAVGSIGLDLAALSCAIRAKITDVRLGFQYRNTGQGRNRLDIQLESCTTDTALDVAIGSNDVLNLLSTAQTFQESWLGEASMRHRRHESVVQGYTSPWAPNARGRSTVIFGALTNGLIVSAPADPKQGDVFGVHFLQDGTGGRTIGWNAVFSHGYANTGNTANTRCYIEFEYNEVAALWLQTKFTPWHA